MGTTTETTGMKSYTYSIVYVRQLEKIKAIVTII
jgi:hypothetical protein